jgi:hypothetical protein
MNIPRNKILNLAAGAALALAGLLATLLGGAVVLGVAP